LVVQLYGSKERVSHAKPPLLLGPF